MTGGRRAAARCGRRARLSWHLGKTLRASDAPRGPAGKASDPTGALPDVAVRSPRSVVTRYPDRLVRRGAADVEQQRRGGEVDNDGATAGRRCCSCGRSWCGLRECAGTRAHLPVGGCRRDCRRGCRPQGRRLGAVCECADELPSRPVGAPATVDVRLSVPDALRGPGVAQPHHRRVHRAPDPPPRSARRRSDRLGDPHPLTGAVYVAMGAPTAAGPVRRMSDRSRPRRGGGKAAGA